MTSDTDDYVAICRLQAAYADTVTRRVPAELHDQLLADTPIHVDTVTNPPVDLVGPAELGAFIRTALERFEFFEFTILNTHVELNVGNDADAARARLYICELRQESETHAWSTAYGVYRDDYRRVKGRWRFARRLYQSLARTGGEVFAYPRSFDFD